MAAEEKLKARKAEREAYWQEIKEHRGWATRNSPWDDDYMGYASE